MARPSSPPPRARFRSFFVPRHPTFSPTAAPTPAPTSAPTPHPTLPTGGTTGGLLPTPGPTEVHGIGDPHLVNLHGQHFDLMQQGVHALLHVPRMASRSKVLLRVDADAQRVGGDCADTYFMSINITGKWVEQKIRALGRASGTGVSFKAGAGAAHTGTKWMSFGKITLKVVHGRTKTGVAYLNFFARNLRHTGFLVGGLLGEDDHADAAEPSSACKRVIES
ncbi:unnamed protein product [Prorocentrum cordatum]|uniref:Jacalin-type lectin domain-containing protein n=1 Tax=Prorocentrum cordatum TaxID=2364126 RepID=A0ABN9TAS2_9DINO|nr:unnamed protein product [Polarella glacialis]